MGSCIFHYVMALLEGAVSGVCLYRARQAEETKHKVLLSVASAVWFALSVLDSLQGGRELREMKTINGGDDDE